MRMSCEWYTLFQAEEVQTRLVIAAIFPAYFTVRTSLMKDYEVEKVDNYLSMFCPAAKT